MEEKILGVIYSASPELINKFVKIGKGVFIKFIPRIREKNPKIRLKKGHLLLFYGSQSGKKILAKAKILDVQLIKYSQIQDKEKKNLLLSKNELRDYLKGREQKPILLLNLKEISLLPMPLKKVKPLTMNGQYITKNNLNKLFLTAIPKNLFEK